MPQIAIQIEMPIYPVTRRDAYVGGWNRGYGFKDHATYMPPFDGAYLAAFEEGLERGKHDKDYDASLSGGDFIFFSYPTG